MKKFEILQEWPKCDTEIWSEEMLGKMALIDLLDTGCHKSLICGGGKCSICEMQESKTQENAVCLFMYLHGVPVSPSLIMHNVFTNAEVKTGHA